ncbi:MAG: SEC-C domain-containing protein [Phycisphaerales bacterium]|nr:SEC-C domain-containing protein [Phycisphaerales bacterium]
MKSKNRSQRNEPCPCGSGQKFKKCCANNKEKAKYPVGVSRTLESAREFAMNKSAAENQRLAKYGDVRPIVQADSKVTSSWPPDVNTTPPTLRFGERFWTSLATTSSTC